MDNQPPRKPIAYDVNAQPIYAEDLAAGQHAQPQAPIPPQLPPQPQQYAGQQPHPQVQPQTQSHVTAAPVAAPGENFDPRIRAQYANEPAVVHTTREVSPAPLPVSPANQERSLKSKHQFPHLNLSDGEYVVLSLRRHWIGLLSPLLIGGMLLFVLLLVLIFYPGDVSTTGMPSFGMVAPIIILVMLAAGLGTAVAVWVYLQNQFYLTNESVIQEIQHSLFSRHEQTVSLGSIEDASFKQAGIIQLMFNYGTIRLSTEGEETTYRFQFVENPREQVAVLNNAIESFKNGRPVDPYEN